MKYKREESFRYEFPEKVACRFKIISISGSPFDGNLCDGHIVDLSPTGLKMFTDLNIPDQKTFVIYLEYKLNQTHIKTNATVLWKKKFGNGFYYGLKTHATREEVRFLVDEIKVYARMNKK